jgi:hypothetical protein
MRIENFVSVWLGIAPCRAKLIDVVQVSYNEDGDYIPSVLMRNFGIPIYDEDLLEVCVFEHTSRDLSVLLTGCSFDATLIRKFSKDIGRELQFEANAVILLFDFQANVEVGAVVTLDEVQLHFLGVETYE